MDSALQTAAFLVRDADTLICCVPLNLPLPAHNMLRRWSRRAGQRKLVLTPTQQFTGALELASALPPAAGRHNLDTSKPQKVVVLQLRELPEAPALRHALAEACAQGHDCRHIRLTSPTTSSASLFEQHPAVELTTECLVRGLEAVQAEIVALLPPGLHAALHMASLSWRLEDAEDWCHVMGAVDLRECIEELPSLAAALELDESETVNLRSALVEEAQYRLRRW